MPGAHFLPAARSFSMSQRFAASFLAFGLALLACQSNDKKPEAETKVATLSAAPPAAVPTATQPNAPSTKLALDPAASKLELVASKVTRSHDGSFKQFSGTATLTGEQLSRVNFEVETASLQTDTDKLTAHIKTPDLLDVEKFPKATFTSTQIMAKPAGTATHEITGALTLHGVTNEVTFPATIAITPERVTGSAEVHIDRQKFGVTYPGMPDDLIKNDVVLKPSFVFPRAK
jgi:polyisoprenoid-binding protein YceI